MASAIKKDIGGYNRDLKSFEKDFEMLSYIKIHPALVHDNKKTLIDYVSMRDLEESKANLDSRKEVLLTKMEKNESNNHTLKEIIEAFNQNLSKNNQQKSLYSSLLTNTYKKLIDMQKDTGFDLLDKNPEALAINDYNWNTRDESDKKILETFTAPVKTIISAFDDLIESSKILFDQYISIIKINFEKLTNINTALGKNEGERIKTLKTYEMFKKEYKYFQTPKCLPKCYEQSIIEMKRRNKYNRFLKYTIQKLKALWEYENNKRDEFLTKNGLYIPKSLMPQLGNKAPFLKLISQDIDDNEYPDKLLTENDKFVNGIDSKVYYFEKVFADISKSIKKGPSQERRNIEVSKLKAEIKNIKEQHESEIIDLLKPYKQEINDLMTQIKEFDKKVEDTSIIQVEKEKLDEVTKELDKLKKEHEECSINKEISLKLETLKRRNADLAHKQDTLLKENSVKSKELKENSVSIEHINSLMKEAMVKLNINVEVPEDASFFENAFKAF